MTSTLSGCGTRRRGTILLVALVAFFLAQAMALAHAAGHIKGDASPPDAHSPLCTDCASLLPLLSVAGGHGPTLALADPVQPALLPLAAMRPALAPALPAFRSRAPPR